MEGNAQEVSLKTRQLIPGPEDAGQRLDLFLSRRLPDWSRSQLQKLIRGGCVSIGSSCARKAGETVTAGEMVCVRLKREELHAAPEEIPIEILYEDDDFAVINKAAGMVVHAGAGVRSGTLVNALLFHLESLSAAAGAERPGIVHRLDKMTSGLILVAKNDEAHRQLATAFKARSVRKTYLALVAGRVKHDASVIDAPIGRDPVHRHRMKTCGIRAREALTAYRVLRRFQGFTLLEVSPHTGRTHQVRVHLASIGHPVVGDTLYSIASRVRGAEKLLNRTFLHALALEFPHPRTGQTVSFTAPLPPELQEFLGRLE